MLGLGDIGALAGKPVMEGKAVLFKKFAGIDGVDLCLDAVDKDDFINTVKFVGPTFGGINLEDIKGPDCFYIEEELKKLMKIPVFHDDQHGTAIIALAGLINACEVFKKDFSKMRIVINGAGAAGIASAELFKTYNKDVEVLLCDTQGVIYKGRQNRMNEFKERNAADTQLRTLEEAVNGADVFIGVSTKGALSKEMVKTMAPNPIIFACANPDPEILPHEVHEVRNDAIVGTGRSDFDNQVNNVMCFPFLFRGTLDMRSTAINAEMKMAAALAIAKLARQDVPAEVRDAYGGKEMKFGRNYVIPSPFDPRLIEEVSIAVARAACETGVAKKPITGEKNWEDYKLRLREIRKAMI